MKKLSLLLIVCFLCVSAMGQKRRDTIFAPDRISFSYDSTGKITVLIKKIWVCTHTYVKGKNRYCNATIVQADTKDKAIMIYKRALNSWPQYHKSISEVPIKVIEITEENTYTEKTVFIKPK